MIEMRRSTVIFITISFGIVEAQSQLPKFENYRATGTFHGIAHQPLVRSPLQKRFRTQIQRQAKLPINFAGRYRVAEWGCGSSCVSMAIVDSATGAVYDGPFQILGYGIDLNYEGGSDQLEYRADSNLFVARGCPEDMKCGTYYYEWKNDRLILVRVVLAHPGTEQFRNWQGQMHGFPLPSLDGRD